MGSNISCVNAEIYVPNTPLPITYAMSDGDVSEPADSDVGFPWPPTIPILADHFRCVMCALTTANTWSPPHPSCSMCTTDLLTCAPTIEETDHEEDVEGEQVVFPRHRRDLKADAMSLWHFLMHTPSNKFRPICQIHKAQYVRHVRGPVEGKHSAKVFGDDITAKSCVFDRHSDDVGFDDMLNGLVMLDVATGFLDCEPSRERDPELPPQTWVSLLVALR